MAGLLRKLKVAEVISYAIARHEIFWRFLTNSLIYLDSNILGRAMRPQTTNHKISLFAALDAGGRTPASPAPSGAAVVAICTVACSCLAAVQRLLSGDVGGQTRFDHQPTQAESGAMALFIGCADRQSGTWTEENWAGMERTA